MPCEQEHSCHLAYMSYSFGMSDIAVEYTLTYQDWVEANRTNRNRKRFLAGPTERSVWFGFMWLLALCVLIAILLVVTIYATGKTVVSATGRSYVQSDSSIVVFLLALLPWPLMSAVIWLFAARSNVERRINREAIFVFLLIGLSMAFASVTSATKSGAQQEASSIPFIELLPIAVALIGGFVIILRVARRSARVVWDAQPHLRLPHRLEATSDRVVVQTPVHRIEYAWPAFISFSETQNIFLLSVSAVGFHTVPKRAFANSEQIDAFRNLLQSRLADTDLKRQGSQVVRVA